MKRRFDVVMGIRAWVLADDEEDAEDLVVRAIRDLAAAYPSIQHAEAVVASRDRTDAISHKKEWKDR